MIQGVESGSWLNLLNQFSSSIEQRYSSSVEQTKMDNFSLSVEKPFHVLLKSWGVIIFNFQWVTLENEILRVYVCMMDDYGLWLMVIEHIAIDYYFFLGK